MKKGFKAIEYNEASDEVKAIYNETMKELGVPFVLNWFKYQGNNATILRGNWEKLRCTMLLGNVPFILKQLIIYNISKIKKSEYCAYTHGVIANSMSKTLTNDDSIKLTENMDSDHIPSSYKTAIRVVTKCALQPQSTNEHDFEELSHEGYSMDEIQELMALADLTNMLNSLADIAGIQIDNELMEVQ
jgi:alkylhydroperoxidase family enzyme